MEALTAAIKINIHHVCPPLNGVLSVMGCSWSHTLLAHSEWAQEMLVWVDGWKKFPANSFSYKAHPWGITSTCFSNSSKQTGGLSVQFNSVTRLCPTLWDPMDCSMPGLPVHHQLPEFIQTHVHWVGDAIQTSHPLSSPSPLVFSLFQHQGLFQWVSSSHQVAKILEFQLQHQSFWWIFRTDLL